jgi:hypothetical protein
MKAMIVALLLGALLAVGTAGSALAEQTVTCQGSKCTSQNPVGNNVQTCKNTPANEPPTKCK